MFTPRHPKTRPVLAQVLKELEKVDVEALLEEAWQSRYTVTRKLYDDYR